MVKHLPSVISQEGVEEIRYDSDSCACAADPLGLRPCSKQADAAAKAANCPQDGQLYQVTLVNHAPVLC